MHFSKLNIEFIVNAYKKYEKFKKNDESYSEYYKYEIFSKLNKKLSKYEINADNIQEITEIIKDNNPQSGTFVHWTAIQNLKKFTGENPELGAELLQSLLNANVNLAERISDVKNVFKQNGETLGTPLVGYLLAAFDKNKYTIYKEDIFRGFCELINLNMPSNRNTGKLYNFYLKVLNKIGDVITEENLADKLSILDRQDFLYTIYKYKNLRFEILHSFLHKFAKKLSVYRNNTKQFIKEIKEIDKKSLKRLKDYYKNPVKINRIRVEIINLILHKKTFNLSIMEDIKKGVSEQYEKDILHSWSNYTILFPLFYNRYKSIIIKSLEHIAECINEEIKENIISKKLNLKIQDFYGAQNFGTVHCFIAFYPDIVNDFRDASQLYLRIDPEKTEYGLKIGSNIQDRYNDNLDQSQKIQNLSIEDVLNKFKEIKSTFMEINYKDDTNINYWKVAPGRNAKYWDEFRKNNIIAIDWDKYNKYGSLKGLTREEIAGRLKLNSSSNVLYTFDVIVNRMEIGDFIVANKGQNKIVGIGELKSEYIYDDTKDKNRHRRKVDWIFTGDKSVNYKFARQTITSLKKGDYENFVKIYKELENIELGNPFNKIFPEYELAINFFDLLKKTYDYLEISDPHDNRISVTTPKNRNMLRLNTGNFATLHFVNRSNSDYRIGMALLEKVKELNPIKTWEPFDSFEDNILLAEFTLKQWNSQRDEILDIFYDTLDHIKQKIKNWSSSSFNTHHKTKIAKAIFDQKKRKRLLANGLTKTKQRFFWITANPSIWTPTKPEYKKETFYTAVNKKGNKRKAYKDFYKAKPEDKIIFYESSSTKETVATGRVTQGLHEELEEGYDEKVPGISVKCEEEIDGTTWEMINNEPTLEESAPVKNKAQGSLFELTEHEYKTILNLKYIENYSSYLKSLKVKKLSNYTGLEPEGLYFENENLIEQIHRALKAGKHIILNGPPGTGKSKLAKEICKHYCGDCYKMTTATSDWSTFDTIGGLMPKNDSQDLKFNKGVFLKCFQNKNRKPDNNWLLLDEINRADIDKAFGALFSALTGDNVTLAQQIDGENIEIIGKPDNEKVGDNRFFIHPDWRIIATMNTFDKTSLYEMSYAFMRRFAFINIGVPDKVTTKTIEKLINIWKGFDNSNFGDELIDKIKNLWSLINKYRKIGPAIIEDMLRYKSNGGNFRDAIAMYVIPQFEGLEENRLVDFYEKVDKILGKDTKELKKVMSDFFEIDEEKFENDKNQE